jgi:SpoVT / AbrB like domain.
MLQAFVQSFSQGQITIPKKFREALNLDKVFWLKLFVDDQKRIIAEPIEKVVDKSSYLKTLSTIKGVWFDIKDYKQMRKETKNRLKKLDANTY